MNQLFNARQSPLATFITGLGRWLALGVVALALWVGPGILPVRYTSIAMAAGTPDTEAPEHGPIRQTHSPLSKENFQGGVDRAALERSGHSEQLRSGPQSGLDSEPGIVDRLKNLVPGLSADESPAASPQSNIQPEPNPTLKRYGGQQ